MQELFVNELIEELDVPQYLQVYLFFSLPSYNLCFPLLEPFGCRIQELFVSDATFEDFAPQYSQ
ncbi:hypothetical protein JCM30204_17380 [Dysgonomonas termitidis]